MCHNTYMKRSSMKIILSIVGAGFLIGVIYFPAPSMLWFFSTFTAFATEVSSQAVPLISIQPTHIKQGDPIMVIVASSASSSILSATFDGEQVEVVQYGPKLAVFLGVNIHKKPGLYLFKIVFVNGQTVQKNILVEARKKVTAPLGIPAKLGGNTAAAAKNVVLALTNENKILAALPSGSQPLWTKAFIFPVAHPVVTDTYGYSRLTGVYKIPHLGVDFAAASGTPIMAINDGLVIMAQDLGIYGTTVVVDHGAGISSFYMHLSKLSVKKGDRVARGQMVGESGQTGYAEGPHLHLSVRINGSSIDPVQFFKFFRGDF